MGEIFFSNYPLTDRAALELKWRALESRADGGFFLSWDWIGCWLSCITADVTVFEGRAEDKAVVLGLLCTAKPRRFGAQAIYLNQTGDPSADKIAIEYNGFLLDRSVAADGAAQALSALIADDGLVWDSLFLHGLSQHFAESVAAAGLPARLRSKSATARIDLSSLRTDNANFLDRCSANTRSQIRRSIRHYETRGPLLLEVASTVEEAQTYFEAMGILHQRAWTERGDVGAFSSNFFVTFHRRLIESCQASGRVELLRLSVGETAIAYLYNFIDGGTVHYYSSGFLYEDDNRLKPGLVAHAMSVEHYLKAGLDTYDFMAGEARYKTSLGQTGPEVVSYVLERQGVRQSVRDALRWVRDRVGGKD